MREQVQLGGKMAYAALFISALAGAPAGAVAEPPPLAAGDTPPLDGNDGQSRSRIDGVATLVVRASLATVGYTGTDEMGTQIAQRSFGYDVNAELMLLESMGLGAGRRSAPGEDFNYLRLSFFVLDINYHLLTVWTDVRITSSADWGLGYALSLPLFADYMPVHLEETFLTISSIKFDGTTSYGLGVEYALW